MNDIPPVIPAPPAIGQLLSCPACGRGVSPHAGACPGCGHPLRVQSTGSTSQVLAGIASFVVPGLGQLVQGRPIAGVLMFGAGCVMWVFFMGWVMHIIAAVEAASHRH